MSPYEHELKERELRIKEAELQLKVLEARKKLFEQRLRYASDYFSFHARQRTTMFNYFMVFVGLIINAVAAGLRDGMSQGYFFVLFLVGFAFAVAFRFVDSRNVQLLETAEDVMRELEKAELFNGWAQVGLPSSFQGPRNIPLAILWREEAELAAWTSGDFHLSSIEKLRALWGGGRSSEMGGPQRSAVV